MGVLAKQAYASGVSVTDLLAVRFALAAPLLWGLVALKRAAVDRHALLAGGALGLVAYALEAGLFFAALERMDAAVASLVLYTYPALVTLAAVLTGRERADRRRVVALLVASAGVALVLLGGPLGGGGVEPLGALLALGAAAGYAGYILLADRAGAGDSPLAFSASVCTGALLTFTLAALVRGGLEVGPGLGWIAAIAVVCTVMPLVAFLAGLARVGPATASILSTAEPAFTVALAFLVLGETLGAVQLLGGGLVLGAVLLAQRAVQLSPRVCEPCDDRAASPLAARPAPARASREGAAAG